jgi:parvulin-like peptidyl-prolyl isomerase
MGMLKIFLVFLFAVGLNATLVDGVAVVVKGSAITLLDVKKEMRLSKLDVKKATDVLVRKKLEELEIKERKISVSSGEVYDELKKTAARNHLSISEFYDAIRNSTGMSSTELKAKIKERLLSQKLYSAIAYSSISTPSEAEIKDYYELHKEDFTHPSAFDVIIYASKDRMKLQQKIANPMFYTPEVQTNEQLLPYDRITPELVMLLTKTEVGHFSGLMPDGKGGFMSFYLKGVKSAKESGLESVKNQIINLIMAKKREQVLGDYFARLKNNADIKIVRTVE